MGTGFFFQAEDGIRDGRVTGVQTCALPICCQLAASDCPSVMMLCSPLTRYDAGRKPATDCAHRGSIEVGNMAPLRNRSEERRVGKSEELGGSSSINKKTQYIRILRSDGRPR